MTVRVTTKGQVTIPKHVRDRLGIARALKWNLKWRRTAAPISVVLAHRKQDRVGSLACAGLRPEASPPMRS